MSSHFRVTKTGITTKPYTPQQPRVQQIPQGYLTSGKKKGSFLHGLNTIKSDRVYSEYGDAGSNDFNNSSYYADYKKQVDALNSAPYTDVRTMTNQNQELFKQAQQKWLDNQTYLAAHQNDPPPQSAVAAPGIQDYGSSDTDVEAGSDTAGYKKRRRGGKASLTITRSGLQI